MKTLKSAIKILVQGVSCRTAQEGIRNTFAVAFERGKKDQALEKIVQKDPDMYLDPESNPTRAWLTTSLSLEDILVIDGVEDAIISNTQQKA